MTEPTQAGSSNDVVVRVISAGTAPWMPNLEHPMAQGVCRFLKHIHDRNAVAAINLPDEYGAFPASSSLGPLGNGVPPVVADANEFRNDVLYACRHNRADRSYYRG